MKEKKPLGPEPGRIDRLFSSVAGRYDLANTVLSFGIHHRWRKEMVRWSGAGPGESLLDCATGTGDVLFAFRRVLGRESPSAGVDFCRPMLEIARAKAARKGLPPRFLQGDALRLPFRDDAFDLAAIAFGIRNVKDPVAGLSEMARVVRPGGKVVVLEFGQVVVPGFRRIYSWFSRVLLPRIGGLVTGRKEAYEYLRDSSRRFPCGEDFLALMDRTGRLRDLTCKPLTGGIAWLYKGTVR